jgi:20S proteasome subunit beta 1
MNFADQKGLDFQRGMNRHGAPLDLMGNVPRGLGRATAGRREKEYSFLESLDPKNQPKGFIQANTRKGEHMLGTSIMAVSFDGGVVLGADSRTSTGSYVANRVSDKLTPVSDYIYCCRSGSAADTQAIVEIAQYYLSYHGVETNSQPHVNTAANVLRNLCYTNKSRLMAGLIIGGWDPVEGGQVYNITLGGSKVRQPFSIGGSGSTYIYAYCDANFRPGMTKEECQAFVKTALSHAMARDGHSGGIVRLCTIDSTGCDVSFVDRADLPYQETQGV